MPRLLLVARNPGLAFGIGSAYDDIIEVRPSLVSRLTVIPGMADVLVIEQESPADALRTLDALRAGGLLAPALLVASTRSDWLGFDPACRRSIALLDPPITQDRLGQAIGTAAELPDVEPGRTDASDSESAGKDPEGPEPRTTPADPQTSHPEEAAVSDALNDPEAGTGSRAQPHTNGQPQELQQPPDDNPDPLGTRPDEDLPIAAAAAHAYAAQDPERRTTDAMAGNPPAGAEDDVLLPDGPPDLEPADHPYSTATRVPVEHDPVAHQARTNEASERELHAQDPDTDLFASASPGVGEHAGSAPTTVLLHDEEAGLGVAEGAPSPASLLPVTTEPVLARQGDADEAGVYAEMALLVAASVENLAEEPQDSDEPPNPPDQSEELAPVDLGRVFGDRAESSDAEADLRKDPPPVPGPGDRTSELAETREVGEVVDLRDDFPKDPRSTPSLVRALLARSNELYGVTEAGALVVADALARTGASSGALLLPDGETWRVAAGEGLRRLEARYVLAADSWLVTTIAARHKGLIIDRTDVARRPLAGAPLAAHKHLVAAPVRAVAGILLIARDDDPGFGERDLMSLARLAEASTDILAAALDARQLARLLGDLRDQDDRAAADRIDYGL